MSLSTYIDYIHTLLPTDQRDAYESSYTTGVTRALTWSGHRPRTEVKLLLESQGRSFTKPNFAVSKTHMYVDREDKEIALGHHRAYQGGRYYIQESAASLPPSIIDYQPNDVILDMCAAPGGKTAQLATSLLALGGSGFVVANEIDNTRRSTLKETVTRLGLYNVTVSYRFSSRRADNYPATFDHIVVDAVCSGEGTCFRTTEFMDQRGLGLTIKNSELQKQMMSDAITCVKPGGSIVFSTCTLNTNENEGVVAWVLENFSDLVELVPVDIEGASTGLSGHALSDEDCAEVARLRPHIQHSGGFWVSKFIKKGGTRRDDGTASSSEGLVNQNISKPSKTKKSSSATIEYNAQTKNTIITSLQSEFGITLPEYTRIYEDKGIGYLTTTKKLTGYESGLPILKLGHGGIQPLAALVPALGLLSSIPRIDLDDEQIQLWMSSTELEITSDIKGRVIVTCHGFDVGLGKIGGGVLKNKMK